MPMPVPTDYEGLATAALEQTLEGAGADTAGVEIIRVVRAALHAAIVR